MWDAETEPPALHVPEAARLQRFIDAGSQLARGVAALHGAGKLHRDIKPNNILVTRTGRVVLLDFGFVTVLGRDPLRDAVSVEIVGTLAYMAPEQLWGQAPAPPADWYSVGVLFYEALTGRLPFERPADLGLYRERRSAPPPLRMLTPWLPERLGRLVGALLDPDPASRPGPDAILHQLENFQTAAAPAARTVVVADDHPFVGRDREQADLHGAFRDLAGGSPIIVHVHGPSGVGKTELVQRVVSALEANEAAVVLRGRCHPQEVVPYKAFDGVVDSLSRFLMSVPESAAAALVPRHASALVQLFPVLERVRPVAARSQERETADPQEVRRRGFAALRELLTRIADRYRLVVWIDDLQWGDEDSAAVAQALLRPPDPPPLLLLLSYRGGDQDRAAIPSLEPAARHIELGPLGH